MRLIDSDALIDRFKPEEKYKYFRTDLSGIKILLEEAPTVEAIPKAKIDKAIERMEKAKEGYYFKYAMELAIDIVKEACE